MAGALAQRMKKTGRLGAAYFCRHNDGTRNDPRNLLGTIACQLCDCNSESSSRMGGEDGVKMFLANSSLGVQELCTKLLEEPLSKCSPFQRKLVVIDALDETEYKSREDFICLIKERFPRFPKQLVFFITSRPEDMLQSRLEKYNLFVRICAGNSEQRSLYWEHEQDIQRFLESRVDFSRLPYSAEDVTKLCNGLFLHAFYIAKELNGLLRLGKIGKLSVLLPGDMDDFFQKNLQRVHGKVGADLYSKLLGCIITAPSPVPVSFISFVLCSEMSDLDEQEVIDAVSQFVVMQKTVTFLHNLIPAWLTNKRKTKKLYIDKKCASEYLISVFKEILSAVVNNVEARPVVSELRAFVVRFGGRFLCQHREKDLLKLVFSCLTSYCFLEERIRSGRMGIYQLLKDLQLAASSLGVEKEHEKFILQEISLAIEGDVHVLVESPHLLRSTIRNASGVVQESVVIALLPAACLCVEWQACDYSVQEIISEYSCLATASDKKTVAMACGRSLLFVDVSQLQIVGGPFEISQDTVARIVNLEFYLDDKFVFFGRRDKWFSVERGCVEDLPPPCPESLISVIDYSSKSDRLMRKDGDFDLSPGQKWMVTHYSYCDKERIRVKKFGGGNVYIIKECERFTFTNDDLFLIYTQPDSGSLHALSLQNGIDYTSVSGRDLVSLTTKGQFGYLFRSRFEDKAGLDRFIAVSFISSDTVLAVTSDSTFTLWKLTEDKIYATFESIPELYLKSAGAAERAFVTKKCVFSLDGKLIAFQQETRIDLHCASESGGFHCTVFEAESGVTDACVKFSADGGLLLICIQENLPRPHFYVWDVRKQVMCDSFKSPGLLTVDCICLSSDADKLVLCGGYYEIEIWEVNKHPCRLLKTLEVERFYKSVRFSQCTVSLDNKLLVCCIGNLIHLYSLSVANVHSSRRILQGHVGKIEFYRFLKVNRYLISYAVDGMVFLWDLTESKPITFTRIKQGEEKIASMALSPEEDRLVCFFNSDQVCVIKLCKLESALSSMTKGKVGTTKPTLQPTKKIPLTANIPTSSLEDYKSETSINSDLEEDFYDIPEDYFCESDESD
ncbi:uncharacterized protein [Porites lutea]|uniref:uncharacterized protein isoform X1 n=1 Tax=Porites lutea TaxID=51062 RepID=UPI003CC56290